MYLYDLIEQAYALQLNISLQLQPCTIHYQGLHTMKSLALITNTLGPASLRL